MLNKYLYDISITIIGIITAIFILTSIGLLLHVPVNIFYLLIPFIAGIFYIKKQSETDFEFQIKLFGLITVSVISYFISVSIWDISYDGRSYHIATIILLKKGWLPLYENYKDFADICRIYHPNALWANCYVHSFEVVGANIYKLTNIIESAKSLNFVMLSCLYMYSCAVLRQLNYKNKLLPLVISALMVLNPVCICQWLTNYIDIHLYCVFTVLIFTIIKIENNKHATKTDLFVFVCSALMTAMSKYTGLMYVFITLTIYSAYLLILKREIKKYLKTVFLIISLIVLTGITPFFTNYRDFGHIFYPVFGENKYNYSYGNYPPGFKNKSSMEKLIISTFSKPVNSIEDVKTHNLKPEFKCPFSPNTFKKPIKRFDSPDMRICGFGYLWSEILILSLIYIFLIRFNSKKEQQIFYLIQSIIVISSIANPQSWWARYIPQLWLFPVTVILFGVLQYKFINKYTFAIKSFILVLISLFAVINAAMIFYGNFKYTIKANMNMCVPYYEIKKNFSKDTVILIMKKPPYKEMSLADETIITHLSEAFGEKNIIYKNYDESKIKTKEFKPLQQFYIIEKQCYFYKLGNRNETQTE